MNTNDNQSLSFQFSPNPNTISPSTATPSPSLTPSPNFSPSPPIDVPLSSHQAPTPPPPPPPPPPPCQEPPSNHAQVDDAVVRVRKGRMPKSMVWDHFQKLQVNGETKAKCLHCNILMSGKSTNGTSHLKDHITLRCPRKHFKIDIKQKLLNVICRIDASARVENNNFSQEVSRKELSTMVILHEYPLAIVDHIGFRRFVSSLNPNFKIISRNTLRSDIMKMFGTEKTLLRKGLEENISRISITTDMWFAYVPCPHNKETLTQVLLDTLNMYNIAEKVSSIVVDNCTTNDAMMDVLKPKFDARYTMLNGEFLHMRCSAHILNLVVQDGMNVIGGAIEKIRDCVSFWTATPKRIEMFENKVRSVKHEFTRRLALDCKTRWNSTFLMLQSALPYKNIFSSLKLQNSKLKFSIPAENDWVLAGKVCDKLKIFHKATEIFSGRKYPTSNLFFRQICEIKLVLTTWLSADCFVIKNMAYTMLDKFNKYWKTINGLLAIAAILDPRNKLECVEFYFSEIYGDEASFEIERIKNLLYDLMVEYQERGCLNENSECPISESTTLGKRTVDGGDVSDKWSQIKKTKKKKVNVRSELDHYLEEDALPESNNFDILQFWNIELKYPTLQKIARDILAIPVSTVASESAFSMGGRVMRPHRSRLHANTIEALMCMQNWILDQYSGYSIENAHACASILVDDDIGEASSGGGEVVDINSDDDEVDYMDL
ncbi:hypothetical protein RND81_12G024200 [Saponaria officinalis]|uniref:BED-type domain-containing protein n=1 Tax=Saponaria officinalis TaxID=3572 RepID=A0AAW1H4C6_SAPOF